MKIMLPKDIPTGDFFGTGDSVCAECLCDKALPWRESFSLEFGVRAWAVVNDVVMLELRSGDTLGAAYERVVGQENRPGFWDRLKAPRVRIYVCPQTVSGYLPELRVPLEGNSNRGEVILTGQYSVTWRSPVAFQNACQKIHERTVLLQKNLWEAIKDRLEPILFHATREAFHTSGSGTDVDRWQLAQQIRETINQKDNAFLILENLELSIETGSLKGNKEEAVDCLKQATVRLVEGSTTLGTGFFVQYAGQIYLITARHVACQADSLDNIRFADGIEYRSGGKLWQLDKSEDVAFQRFDKTPENITPLPLSDNRAVEDLDEVVTLGFPSGVPFEGKGYVVWSQRTTPGVRRRFDVTFDGAVDHGQSGSPVIRISDRQLIGMIVRKYNERTEVEGDANCLSSKALCDALNR